MITEVKQTDPLSFHHDSSDLLPRLVFARVKAAVAARCRALVLRGALRNDLDYGDEE